MWRDSAQTRIDRLLGKACDRMDDLLRPTALDEGEGLVGVSDVDVAVIFA